ncbi:Chaperone protein dnaJ 49 [Linum perenne]
MNNNDFEILKHSLRIAAEAFAAGDRAGAAKIFFHARRLDPDLFNYDPTAETTKKQQQPTEDVDSDSEKIELVRRINANKDDYYGILGLEKSCSAEDVRRAYKKLSLKVHPDKNNAAGAEEAFKAISKAFQCLCDEQSRKAYDRVTGDRRSHQGGFNTGDRRSHQGGFNAGDRRSHQGGFNTGDRRSHQGGFNAGDRRSHQGGFNAGDSNHGGGGESFDSEEDNVRKRGREEELFGFILTGIGHMIVFSALVLML